MTHLKIEQNGITEEVLSSVISKLYELALSGDLDESSYLIGRLHTNATYLEYIDFLTNKFLNLYITSNKIYILFTDKNLELILLNAGIGDGIGISTVDAADASFTNSMFDSNNITQFPEFKYFTKVNTNSIGLLWLFRNSALTSIDLSNTTKLGLMWFMNCSSLNDINNLQNVETIKGYCFYGCNNLQIKLNLPNLLSIEEYTFYGTGITEIEDLGSISNIPQYCFAWCSNLTKVCLPNSCTQLGNTCFEQCTNLIEINVDNILTIGSSVFGGSSNSTIELLNFKNLTTVSGPIASGGTLNILKVKQVYFPKISQTFKGYYSNYWYHTSFGTNLKSDLIYFKDIQKFYGHEFLYSEILALVINNINPPTWDYDSSEGGELTKDPFKENWSIAAIYVPDSALNTYLADTDWSTVTIPIKGMNELSKYSTKDDWITAGKPVALIEEFM